MVYCGKPSKGCSNCRERKIKCDQREPGCGQCEKRQQQCPGYRNIVDLMFRDESSHVIKKAAKARSRRRVAAFQTPGITEAITTANSRASSENPEPVSRANSAPPREGLSTALSLLTPNSSSSSDGLDWSSPEDDDDLPSPDEGTWPSTPVVAVLYTLAPSFQERGTAFFFSRFVSSDENPCHQNYDFIYDMWKPVSLLPERQVDGVLASMTAVGLAGLSALTHNSAMMDWARRSYGTALRLTNEALRSASDAVKDNTMLAVLILGTYEMLTGRSPQTAQAWQEHVRGAAALAKMRGVGQFQSKAGIRMFLMSHRTVMFACLHQDMPMPKTLIDLRNELGRLIGTDAPGWRLPEPIYTALQVRYDITHGILTDPDTIIEKLTALDDEFVAQMAEFPAEWAYQVVSVSHRSPMMLSSSCHIYPSVVIAYVWNGIRTMRLLIHETIISQILASLDGEPPERIPELRRRQLARSVVTLIALRDAMLASVPQFFGVVSIRDAKPDHPLSPVVSTVSAKDSPRRVVQSPASEAPSSPPPRPGAEPGNPTLLDPLLCRGSQDAVERFMSVALTSHTIVWPLYLLGTSSSSTLEIREYVTDRLLQVYRETALAQARSVVSMVQESRLNCPWAEMALDDLYPQVEHPFHPL